MIEIDLTQDDNDINNDNDNDNELIQSQSQSYSQYSQSQSYTTNNHTTQSQSYTQPHTQSQQSQQLTQRELNKQQKEHEKLRKIELKKQEKENKKEDAGRHRDHEISIIVDQYFSNSSAWGWEIQHYFQENFPNYGFFLSNDITIPTIIKRDYQQQLQQQEIQPGIIRWTFRKHRDNGHCNVGAPGSKTIPFNVIITPCGDFLDAMTDSDDFISFPSLEKWVTDIKRIIYKNQEKDKDQIRIVLVLNDVDKEAAKPKYANKHLTDLIDTAIAFLIFELEIEVFKFKEKNEFLEYLSSVTRINADLHYKQPIDELDCEKKVYTIKHDEEYKNLTPQQQEQYDVKEQWIGMLMMMNMVSHELAKNIANIYICPRALYEAYNRCSTEKERIMLLTNVIRPGRNEKTLSKQIYEVMYGTDPTSVFDDKATTKETANTKENNNNNNKITNYFDK